jgi:hypothetical protein
VFVLFLSYFARLSAAIPPSLQVAAAAMFLLGTAPWEAHPGRIEEIPATLQLTVTLA